LPNQSQEPKFVEGITLEDENGGRTESIRDLNKRRWNASEVI
jgi:hypothetical protein